MSVRALRRLAHSVVHAASLLLTAWALLATSADDPPRPYSAPSDCFAGVPSGATLDVTLGDVVANPDDAGVDAAPIPDGGALDGAGDDGAAWQAPAATTCAGVDGLVAGSPLVLDVFSQPNAGAHASDGGVCFGYKTVNLRGPAALTYNYGAYQTDGTFTSALGSFELASSPACLGSFAIYVSPPATAPADSPVSPVGAAPGSWTLTRSLSLDQAQFCGSAFTARGALTCIDTFVIASVTEEGD
jgi:hypothetical protein